MTQPKETRRLLAKLRRRNKRTKFKNGSLGRIDPPWHLDHPERRMEARERMAQKEMREDID